MEVSFGGLESFAERFVSTRPCTAASEQLLDFSVRTTELAFA
jgi:hypothetical protein